MRTDVAARDLRLVIYDRTAGALANAWWAGTHLYRALGWVARTRGVGSWQEGLEFLANIEPDRRIREVQFWGHGKWGDARIGTELLDERALGRGGTLRADLSRVRARLVDDALWWFRTCETLGAAPGHSFARAFSEQMGCRVAGHTYVIAVWQSGLHALAPGSTPGWDPTEGLAQGSASRPLKAKSSSPLEPNTISCFEARLPEAIAAQST